MKALGYNSDNKKLTKAGRKKQAWQVHVKFFEELHIKPFFNSITRISGKFTSKALSNGFKIRSLQTLTRHSESREALGERVER